MVACRCYWLWDSSNSGGNIKVFGPRPGLVPDELDQLKAIIDRPGRCSV